MKVVRLHVEGETGGYDLVRARPPAALRPYIDAFEWYAEATAPQIQRQFPFGRLPFIVSIGDGLGVADAGDTPAGEALPGHHSFVAGLGDTFTDTGMSGRWVGLQLNFTPLGARHLLGMPLAELTNRSVELSDLLGIEGSRLVDRIQDEPDPVACFSLLEDAIVRRLAANEPVAPQVAWVWKALVREPGASIAGLAHQVGWSRKHLAERFRAEIGLAPKMAARVLRFERAHRMASATAETPNWAEVAAVCGYYDQSHLVRDFREFTGTHPTGYLEYLLFRGVER